MSGQNGKRFTHMCGFESLLNYTKTVPGVPGTSTCCKYTMKGVLTPGKNVMPSDNKSTGHYLREL